MGNFYKDNDDLRFYVERGIDWEPLVELTEYQYRSEGGFKTAHEALEFYEDILTLVGEFVADEIAPHAAKIDVEGVEYVDGEAVFCKELQGIFDGIRGLELHGMCLPREFGGMNVPLLLYMLNSELIARADTGVMTHHSFHGGMAMAMLIYSVFEGSSTFDPENAVIVTTRFAKEIEEIRTGKAWGCMDITEPDAGSDMAAIRTVGSLAEDGSWTVSGQKIFITSGHGKYHFVIARTEKAADPNDPFAGLKGLSMFMVPAYEDLPDGTRNRIVSLDRLEEKLGHHSSATCSLTFEDAPAHLIGARGEGFKYMLLLMNNARVGVGFESLGLCESAYRMAKAYAAERSSMGKTIDQHEMIADYLDEMDTNIRGIRALAVAGCYHEEMGQKLRILLDHGVAPGTLDAARAEKRRKHHVAEARRLTPLLKYIAAERAVELARLNVQIHGGVGYTIDYGAEKLLRDAIVLPIYEGTSQIQSLMVMKDTLGGIIKNPQGFIKRIAQARWRTLSVRDPLERRVAKLQGLSLSAQQHLIRRTATGKFRGLSGRPITTWPRAFFKTWDPKSDFAFAMLHAERLTQLLTDEAICELLLEQAKQHEDRRPILERYLERAEPRCRMLHDAIHTTGQRLLDSLSVEDSEPERAAS